MEWLILILIVVAIVLITKGLKAAKTANAEEDEAEQRAEAEMLEDSDFVNKGMQILSAMLELSSEGTSSIGVFCVHLQDNSFLFQNKVRSDSFAYSVKYIDEYIYAPNGKMQSSNREVFEHQLNGILKRAAEKEDRLKEIVRFADLNIKYYLDPEDHYDEWVVFEKKLPVPSKAHVRALKIEVEKKYPNDRRISFHGG